MKSVFVSAGIAVMAAIAPLEARAASFSQLYVFGDSLVDAGNLFRASSTLSPLGIPQSPPYAQRLSNGPVWVEYLADSFELEPALFADLLLNPFATDVSEGIHFGVAGASTGTDNTVVPDFPLDTGALAQVTAFSSLVNFSGVPPAEDALFVYLAGGNDFAGSEAMPAETDITVPLQNTSAALQALVGSGAKNILVSSLPDLSLTPRFLGTPEAPTLSSRVTDYNTALSALVEDFVLATPDVNFIDFDLNGELLNAIANPDKFDFANVTDACLTDYSFPIDLDGFTVCDTPDQFLFWDDFHPTTQGHKFVAQAALSQLDGRDPDPKAVSIPESSMVGGMLVLMAAAGGTRLLRR
ncbi:MAG: SGNH/GDSL hydrolase family protein [Cyanobacteria bacterium P01_E01_bin.43]